MGGKEPYEGCSDFLLTEHLDYYGLAGDPIYVHEPGAIVDLKALASASSPGAEEALIGLLHELSHTFDGIASTTIAGDWNFDQEFFAVLKKMYALEANRAFSEAGMLAWERAWQELGKSNTLNRGVYSSRAFVYELLVAANAAEIDVWFALRQTFVALDAESGEKQPVGESMRRFWRAFNGQLGLKLESYFSEKAWDTVLLRFGIDAEPQGSIMGHVAR